MVHVPLLLWNQPHWELSGRHDSVAFFRHLGEALPTATTLFVEGSGMARDVRTFFESAAEPGDYLPERQTIWPRSVRYRLPFNSPTLAALAHLAEQHADPELLHHLFVYAGSEALLEFPDAFDPGCPILVSCAADKAGLRALAEAIGLELRRVGAA
jgi:hypothetical protein